METPSSTTRRVTRSQALIAASNSNLNNNNIPVSRKIEDSDKEVSKSRPRTTGALFDITNDSPIVGLAMEKLVTPSSALSKKRMTPQSKNTCTPGSGEALLRGQVKTLLQKVEEEAEISKISMVNKQFLNFQGFVNSPITLLAPTPANTPQIENLLGTESFKNHCLAAVTPSPVQEQLMISQMVTEIVDGLKQGGSESEKNLITRSLLFDFSDKSDGSDLSDCSLVHTNAGSDNNQGKNKSPASEDDDSSVWSIQVNTSARDDDDHEEEFGDGVVEDVEDYCYEDDEDGGLVDELCEGIRKISVNGAKFEGKHTRFVYTSDDEIEGEEECGSENENSPSVLRLKGLPTPKGKHLRFPEDN